jgi:L-alanine-DL-glutamate epimerase-like enolase superfamily enzyme
MGRRLTVSNREIPLSRPFVIARGAKTHARQIEVALREGAALGRGAAVPYARYGETLQSAAAALDDIRPRIEAGLSRVELLSAMAPCAARAALDAALWDLEAQLSGVPVFQAAGLPKPASFDTAMTLVVDAPVVMAARAASRAFAPILKMKLAGDGVDPARVEAVLAAAPHARLILDANEGLDRAGLRTLIETLPNERIALIEQPLPVGLDGALAGLGSSIPLYADESFHTPADLARLKGFYQGVNVKLEKAGGLTAAIAAIRAARREGFSVMLGCMVVSSLGLAPAYLLAPLADVVDLDGFMFLAADDPGGIVAAGARLSPPTLWGAARGRDATDKA